MMHRAWHCTVALMLALLSGCNHHAAARDASGAPAAMDAALADGAPDAALDAADAPGPDAACPGYTSDAPGPVASPACTSGATMYADFGTSLTTNMVRVGSTLYAGVYDTAGPGGAVTAGRVMAIDLDSGAQSMVLSRSGAAYHMSTANDWVFAAESGTDGSIWRWRDGEAPAAVLTHRSTLGAVTADATYMYWNEAPSGSVDANLIQRQPLCGGPIDTLIAGCTSTLGLVSDGQHAYCASFGHDVYAAAADGSSSGTIAYSSYPWTSLILVDSTLYGTDVGDLTIHAIPTPGGPATTFASTTTGGRFLGLAASDAYLYATSTGGIYRIDRANGAYTQLTSDSAEAYPVLWHGQLFYLTRSAIMRCTD